MSRFSPPPPTPLRTVLRTLWRASRQRAKARTENQKKIIGQVKKKAPGRTISGPGLSSLLAFLGAVFLHLCFAWVATSTAQEPARIDVEARQIALDRDCWANLEELCRREAIYNTEKAEMDSGTRQHNAARLKYLTQTLRQYNQAKDYFLTQILNRVGSKTDQRTKLRKALETRYAEEGKKAFVLVDNRIAEQLKTSRVLPAPAVPLLALFFLLWLSTLICQGEGLELDIQRRRHPMWEWLLSHPVRPAHVFYAELLSPLMANPIYYTAPVFLWFLLGSVHGFFGGLAAALLAGIPLAVSCSAAYKALEYSAMLRLSLRSRGAALGILSWVGYLAMIIPFILMQIRKEGTFFAYVAEHLGPWVPSFPIRALLVGWTDTTNLAATILSWWILAGALGLFSILACSRLTENGLQTRGTNAPKPSRKSALGVFLGRDPLRHKELLWLRRDRGAIVQIVLIPLTVAFSQLAGFSGFLGQLSVSWTMLCGLGIICGTYFLTVIGPRSLSSEGNALWMPLTWPCGLEALLKAKARLWSQISNVIVGLILLTAVFLFPAEIWKIAAVALGWLLFSETLAMKSVSLVTPPSSSGEAEPPNRAAYWFSMLGTLSFGAGVLTGTWHVAIIGIVFSSLMSAAMWQRLKARLPYLFDPWSLRPVPSPSLLEVTIGIAVFMEVIGVAIVLSKVLGTASAQWLTYTLAYGIVGFLTLLGMQKYLTGQGVHLRDIALWRGERRTLGLGSASAAALLLGAVLAGLAAVYVYILQRSSLSSSLNASEGLSVPQNLQLIWFFILVALLAPLSEEYLFRGLLYRSLESSLGGWRAIFLSAAIFAVIHPPPSWFPVLLVGIASAWLFRASRHLVPSILLHVCYNSLVLVTHLWQQGS